MAAYQLVKVKNEFLGKYLYIWKKLIFLQNSGKAIPDFCIK
jgi:hypothetical protein